MPSTETTGRRRSECVSVLEGTAGAPSRLLLPSSLLLLTVVLVLVEVAAPAGAFAPSTFAGVAVVPSRTLSVPTRVRLPETVRRSAAAVAAAASAATETKAPPRTRIGSNEERGGGDDCGLSTNDPNKRRGRIVAVEVERTFHVAPPPLSTLSSSWNVTTTSTAPPEQVAKEAWLEFVWKQGGGLAATAVIDRTTTATTTGGSSNEEEDDGDSSSYSAPPPPAPTRRRLLLPIAMEEEIVDDENRSGEGSGGATENTECTVKYRVSRFGPFLERDAVPGSHTGTVTFRRSAGSSAGTSTVTMNWKVQFAVENRYAWWKAVTESAIGQVCDNFVAYMRPPLVYKRTIRLSNVVASSAEENAGPKRRRGVAQEVADQWLDFVWDQGGGLPVYPPLVLRPREKRMYVPPFLKETIVSTRNVAGADDCEINNDIEPDSEIVYKVANPSVWTSYPVHSHLGRVQFVSLNGDNDGSVDMIWTVEVRPYHGFEWFVKAFTSGVVTTLARDFKSHVEEPGAMVTIRPPRGGSGNEEFGRIRKDSWIGGVLDAHLRDQRSTALQTVAMFQPWTWGRSTDDVEAGEGEMWTTADPVRSNDDING